MAKFARFDSRNKKFRRNKKISLQKDIRIHEVSKGRKLIGHTFAEWVDIESEEIEEKAYED